MNLVGRPSDCRRRCDHLRPYPLPIDFPRAQFVYGRLVQPNQRSQRTADQVQLVLDNEVRRPKQGARRLADGGKPSPLRVRRGVLDLGGDVSVARAVPVDTSEQHLRAPVPR